MGDDPECRSIIPIREIKALLDRKLRILAVTNIYPVSNPALGTYVEQQVRSLRNIGLDVDVWFVDRELQGRGVYLSMSKRLLEKVQASRYDLVHVMYSGLVADLATKAVQHIPIPTLITIHGSDLLGSELSRPIQRLSAYWGVLASRRAARRADGVIVVSRALRDALPVDIDRSKVRIIPCGIDLDCFKPRDPDNCRQELGWNRDSNTFHILFATRGDPIKRPKLASSAVAALRRLGMQAEMHEMRGIPYDRVPIWINASDALILTSQHEGSPTITKECLACNVPVVSVDVGDVRDQVEGINGCWIATEDPADLAMGLRVACLTRRIGVDSRCRMGRWSLRRTAERIDQLYRELLSAKALAGGECFAP